jgi:hypothetical protein
MHSSKLVTFKEVDVGLGGAVGTCVDVGSVIGVVSAIGDVREVQLTNATANIIPHKRCNRLCRIIDCSFA